MSSRSFLPLPQLLCEWQRHLPGGFSKSRHPGHPGCQGQGSLEGDNMQFHVWMDTEVSGVQANPFLLGQEVNQVSPGKPVWLGETSSAYGGGAPGLSDTFAAGFM